jgi:hypothetical protein
MEIHLREFGADVRGLAVTSPSGPNTAQSVSIPGFDKSPGLCYPLRRFRTAELHLASSGCARKTKYVKEVLFDGQ